MARETHDSRPQPPSSGRKLNDRYVIRFPHFVEMFYMEWMPEPQQRFSVISDKSLVDLRKLMGVPIEDSLEPWCYEASRDNIRHWAHGIGDDNPLWCDPKYAATTSFKRLQAPPSFIFPLNRSFSGYVGGLAGVHAMFAGIDVTWHQRDDARRFIHHQGVAQGSRRARHPFCRALDPADLSMRILQSEQRAGCRGRQLVLSHRTRHGARARHQV